MNMLRVTLVLVIMIYLHFCVTDQYIIFGCDEGIYMFNLTQIHEGAMDQVRPHSFHFDKIRDTGVDIVRKKEKGMKEGIP